MPSPDATQPLPITQDCRQHWRGVEELADSDAFVDYIRREFPEDAAEWTDPVTRRRFLTLMGASLALAGLEGCSGRPAPAEKIMPYIRQPEGVVPGKPLYFATAMSVGGCANGLIIKSHEGRPTKAEGNPDHPASPPAFTGSDRFGPTDLFGQASVLDLYDPDRSQSVTYVGEPRPWDEFLASFRAELERLSNRGGTGLRILSGVITSPTLASQRDSLLRTFPQALWHQYEPVGRGWTNAGVHQAFAEGEANAVYDLAKAEVVVALDADFLACGPGNLRYTRDFAARRRIWGQDPRQARMNRLHVAESTPSITGSVADHHLPVRSRDVEALALAISMELGVPGAPPAGALTDEQRRWVARAARDVGAHRSAGVVLVGDGQPPLVHAAGHALNQHLGNVGHTVRYTEPIESRPENVVKSLVSLAKAMHAGQVEVLVLLGVNPVFTAPVDLAFAQAMQSVRLRVHLGLYQDETAVQCHWHVPEAHFLESWSDARAYDGTASIVQPLIEPLYGGRSAHELLSAFSDQPDQPGLEIVQQYWRAHWPRQAGSDFEQGWHQALRLGIIPGSQAPSKAVTVRRDWASPLQGTDGLPRPGNEGLEIVFRPDPAVYDGRFANNGWLQEFPRPVTRMTWDNPVLISPATARALNLSESLGHNAGEHGQAFAPVVRLQYRGRELLAPAWIVPGHADGSVTVHFGQGRTRAGRVGTGAGFDFYRLRTSDAPWIDDGLQLAHSGDTYPLACVQMHHGMAHRAPVKATSLLGYRADPEFAHAREEIRQSNDGNADLVARPEGIKGNETRDRRLVPLTLYDDAEYPYEGYKWGMAIDLTACVGCGACVVACQAENNIPVVGKTEVTRGREMHWLRIDRYYTSEPGDPDALANPTTYFQPVPCMHCENAPCELVCPVGATVHSDDGLNDMVYNRCVGTRYCSNNCPYKVRRFNFFEYADYATQSLKLMHNPEVTVRSRGVMEKCTYCVQRIRSAEIEAKRQERTDPARPNLAPIHDGEIMTACQAACPAGAIVFGDLNDPGARVRKMKEAPLDYGLLADLNTRPRTTYLAAVRNPG